MRAGGEALERTEQARLRLILGNLKGANPHPFWGALALGLELKPNGMPGPCAHLFATDGRAILVPLRAATLPMGDIAFSIAHEVGHCGLGHLWRTGNRDFRTWSVACDLAINSLLATEGLPAPEEIRPLFPQDHGLEEGLSSEQYYRLLKGRLPESLHGHLDPSFQMAADGLELPLPEGPQPGITRAAAASLELEWRDKVREAAVGIRLAGDRPGEYERFVDALDRPQVNWRQVLAEVMPRTGYEEDWNFPDPRYRHLGLHLPSRRPTVRSILVALDTSGSISRQETRAFLSEVSALALEADLTVIACDCRVAGVRDFPAGEAVGPEELKALTRGGGGTSFVPVFEWVERNAGSPDMLLYFTDGAGLFPGSEPAYPVVWVSTWLGEEGYPFGRVVMFEP